MWSNDTFLFRRHAYNFLFYLLILLIYTAGTQTHRVTTGSVLWIRCDGTRSSVLQRSGSLWLLVVQWARNRIKDRKLKPALFFLFAVILFLRTKELNTLPFLLVSSSFFSVCQYFSFLCFLSLANILSSFVRINHRCKQSVNSQGSQ